MSDELVETPAIEETTVDQVETVETPDTSEAQNTDVAAEGEAEPQGQEPKKELSEVEKVKAAMQKRIDRLTAQKTNAERQFQDAIANLQKYEQPKSNAPKEEDFETTEDYLKAVGKYEAQQEIEAQKKAEAQDQANKAYQAQVEAKRAEISEKEAEIRKTTPDYDEKVAIVTEFIDGVDQNTVEFKTFRDVLFGMKNMPAISYKLGSDPDLMESMAKQSPIEIARTLFRLEYDLENAPKQNVKPVAAPPKPISSNSKGNRSLNDKSGSEILEWAGIKY